MEYKYYAKFKKDGVVTHVTFPDIEDCSTYVYEEGKEESTAKKVLEGYLAMLSDVGLKFPESNFDPSKAKLSTDERVCLITAQLE